MAGRSRLSRAASAVAGAATALLGKIVGKALQVKKKTKESKPKSVVAASRTAAKTLVAKKQGGKAAAKKKITKKPAKNAAQKGKASSAKLTTAKQSTAGSKAPARLAAKRGRSETSVPAKQAIAKKPQAIKAAAVKAKGRSGSKSAQAKAKVAAKKNVATGRKAAATSARFKDDKALQTGTMTSSSATPSGVSVRSSRDSKRSVETVGGTVEPPRPTKLARTSAKPVPAPKLASKPVPAPKLASKRAHAPKPAGKSNSGSVAKASLPEAVASSTGGANKDARTEGEVGKAPLRMPSKAQHPETPKSKQPAAQGKPATQANQATPDKATTAKSAGMATPSRALLKYSRSGSRPRHHNFTKISCGTHPWNDEEVDALRRGLAKYGPSWAKILRDPEFCYSFHKTRDGVKLKDKARNLNKTNSWDAPQESRAMPKKVLASYSSIDKDTVSGLRKKNEPWTLEEEVELKKRVAEYGEGKWVQILHRSALLSEKRSDVQIKDKWRNIKKAEQAVKK